MELSKRPTILRYGVVLITVGAAGLGTALIPQLRQRESCVLFFGAVTISAWYGGTRPGLLSCLLAAFVYDFFIVAPIYSLTLSMAAFVEVLGFFMVAAMISNITTRLTLAEEKTRAELKQLEEADRKIREYQERLRSLASELSLAEERERRYIATCLHDRVGQTLALANIKLRTLRSNLKDERHLAPVDEITQLLKQMISEMRSLTFELSPPILYEFGLDAALEWLAENMSNSHGVPCAFKVNGVPVMLPQDARVVLFQAARELLTNVAKHANATHTTVTVTHGSGKVCVVVEDDGNGFDAVHAQPSPSAKGMGLFSVRERLTHLGGSMTVKTAPGEGTSVSMVLPLTLAKEKEKERELHTQDIESRVF